MLKRNQVRFGSTSFKCSSRTIWNTLPHHLNCQNFLQNFKKAMKCWNGENCECSDCQSVFWSTSPPSQHLLVWSWQWWHWCWVLTLSWWVGPYRIETSPLICSANQTDFYMTWISIMGELRVFGAGTGDTRMLKMMIF